MSNLLKIISITLLLSSPIFCTAQIKFLNFLNEDIDTNYISDKTRTLTVRALGSTKYNNQRFIDGSKKLSYNVNNNYNAGVGAVYGFLGANVTVKLPGINNDTLEYGKTKKFDVQGFLFTRKLALDVYLQYYKGYYVAEDGITQTHLPSNKRPLRADIRTQHWGVNGSYVFNAKRFSYKAAFIQNEYQKKSAGSALLGGGVHYNRIAGDSALIPSDITYNDYFDNSGFNKMGAVSVGVHGGYAHTFVIAKHFFVTGSAVVGVGGNYSYYRDDAADVFEKGIGFQANLSYKAAIGYNSEKFYAGLNYLGYIQRNSTPISNAWLQYEPSVVRLILAYRFQVHPPWEKRKKPKAVLDVQ